MLTSYCHEFILPCFVLGTSQFWWILSVLVLFFCLDINCLCAPPIWPQKQSKSRFFCTIWFSDHGRQAVMKTSSIFHSIMHTPWRVLSFSHGPSNRIDLISYTARADHKRLGHRGPFSFRKRVLVSVAWLQKFPLLYWMKRVGAFNYSSKLQPSIEIFLQGRHPKFCLQATRVLVLFLLTPVP